MQFLGLLRNKYLAMSAGEDKSFKSVILGRVHDIKNIKLKIREEKDRVFNSPWNVAADFRVDMSFSTKEIEAKLFDYTIETGISMDTGLLSNEIRKFTSGYPYLVSRLCKNIDEYLDKDWSLKGLEAYNKVFEERIYNYMLAQQEMRAMAAKFTSVDEKRLIENGKLDMEKTLLKFQEFMYEQYRQEDERFYETNGRLIFLAYLKPILNGRGFSFVEAQTRENRRMDVVITFCAEKFVVQLKIWNGKKYEEKGLEQLADYLEIQNLGTGYMVVFNFNTDKKYSAQWVEVKGKKVFEVIV